MEYEASTYVIDRPAQTLPLYGETVKERLNEICDEAQGGIQLIVNGQITLHDRPIDFMEYCRGLEIPESLLLQTIPNGNDDLRVFIKTAA